ncbi:unnamed protein product [Rotaria sp. Silwood1]|nr:unnamed protein product [Rotaria sp. Silwood1]
MNLSINRTTINQWRKWIGVIWLVIEVNLTTGNIFGFPALFKVLPKYGVYSSYCQLLNTTNSTEQGCSQQTQQYQILIHNNKSSLSQLSYIWMSFGALMFFSSFLFLDWKFPILNLGYTFDTKLEQTKTTPVDEVQIKTKWYEKIYRRIGLWEHLTNPLYILVVLYLSFLLMPNILLSVTWYPWVYYINHNDKTISKYIFLIVILLLNHLLLKTSQD